MRRILLFAALVLSLSAPAVAGDVYVGRVPWSQANVEGLHGADLATVAKFVNATRPATFMANQITPNQVAGFAWSKAGAGKSDLVVAIDFAGRGFYRLWIYSHGSGDSLAIQELEGWKMPGGLTAMIQDLKGNGVDELILPTDIPRGGSWTPTTAGPLWPAIYRPENGKFAEVTHDFWRTRSVEVSTSYVEASRDFPKYYDTEILPNLDRTISMLRQKAAGGEGNPGALAHAMVVKDKILRVLGRNPTAGLSQAYQWMNSDDPQVLQCARATFYDIGGHQVEVNKLNHVIPGAIAHAIEVSKGEVRR